VKCILTSVAVAALALGAALPARAQWVNHNQIIHSGNGAYNSIAVVNRPPAYPFPGPAYGAPFVQGPAFPAPGYGGYRPGAQFPLLRQLLQGGVNVNVIKNSANGVGNSVFTTNRGGPGGININIIKDSANGAGNRIGIGNFR
jgi:hypothetical protein